jgi:hypothetical protein
VAHQRIVAVVRLDDRGCLKIEFVAETLEGLLYGEENLQTMNHLVEAGGSLVDRRDVNISPFLAVSVRVEGVRTAVFVISEDAKVLRPVSERGGCIDEGVWPANGV